MAYTDLFPGNNPHSLSDRIIVNQEFNPHYVQFFSGHIIHFLFIVDTVTGIIIPDPHRVEVTSTITIAQTIVLDTSKVFSTEITVQQSIICNVERIIHIVDNLPIQQFLVPFKVHSETESGNDGDVFVDPEVIAYQAGLPTVGNVTFAAGSDTITIRKPEFGDTVDYKQFRVQRTPMGGDPLQIYKDPMWPIYQQFEMKWVYLNETDKVNLLIFLSNTLGKKITFHNHFGEVYIGFIITPFEKIMQPKRIGWSASFTFQIDDPPNPI